MPRPQRPSQLRGGGAHEWGHQSRPFGVPDDGKPAYVPAAYKGDPDLSAASRDVLAFGVDRMLSIVKNPDSTPKEIAQCLTGVVRIFVLTGIAHNKSEQQKLLDRLLGRNITPEDLRERLKRKLEAMGLMWTAQVIDEVWPGARLVAPDGKDVLPAHPAAVEMVPEDRLLGEGSPPVDDAERQPA